MYLIVGRAAAAADTNTIVADPLRSAMTMKNEGLLCCYKLVVQTLRSHVDVSGKF